MGKTQCIRDFKCEVCGIPGMLQILSENYARVRHYRCLKDGKPHFEYHRNSIEYVNKMLTEIKAIQERNNNLSDHNSLLNIDQKINVKAFFNENTCGRSLAWFRTSACHAEDPGSNPGGRTIVQIDSQRFTFSS